MAPLSARRKETGPRFTRPIAPNTFTTINSMMIFLTYVADFFAGAFLCNCIPHLTSRLQGVPFPSPFAKPRGVGDSSPLVNVFWGSFNLFVGVLLLHWNPGAIGFHPKFIIFVTGFLALGVQLSLHFGKVRRGRTK